MEKMTQSVSFLEGAMGRLFFWLMPCLFVLLGWVNPAQAGDAAVPIEGREYWILPQCEKGTCVRIAPDINLNTPAFAEKLGTTPTDIRKDNPQKTIALCKRPGDGYEMGKIMKPADRASDEIWTKCPDPKLQYVYILPGQVIQITGVKHKSYNEEMALKEELKHCKTSDCARRIAVELGAPIDSGAAPDTQARFSDEIVAKLAKCTTAECAVNVAKEAGAKIEEKQNELVQALKACSDDACMLKVLGDYGISFKAPPQLPAASAAASVAPPPPAASSIATIEIEVDKLERELKACSDDACRYTVLSQSGVEFKQRYSPAETPAAPITIIEHKEAPRFFWWLLGLAFLVAVGALWYAYRVRKTFKQRLEQMIEAALDKERADHLATESEMGAKLRQYQERIFGFAKSFEIPIPDGKGADEAWWIVFQDAETKFKQRRVLDQVFRAFLTDSQVSLPSIGTPLEDLWSRVREIADANKKQVADSEAQAETLRKQLLQQEARGRQEAMQTNERLREIQDAHKKELDALKVENTQKTQELARTQESFRDIQGLREEYGKLVPGMADNDLNLRRIDDRITVLTEERGQLFNEMVDKVKAADSAAFEAAVKDMEIAQTNASFRELVERLSSENAEVLRLNERIKRTEADLKGLGAERQPLLQKHVAYEGLHERLTGHKPIDTQLYEEAQRDRNDAAAERAQAELERRRAGEHLASASNKKIMADEMQETVRLDRERLDKGLAALEKDRQLVQSIMAQSVALMREVINLMDLDPNLPAEEYLKLTGPQGIMKQLVELTRGLQSEVRVLKSRLAKEGEETGQLQTEYALLRQKAEKLEQGLTDAVQELESAKTSSSEEARLQARVTELEAEIERLKVLPDEAALEAPLVQPGPPSDLAAATAADDGSGVSGARPIRKDTLRFGTGISPLEGPVSRAPGLIAAHFFDAVAELLTLREQCVVDSPDRVQLLNRLARARIFRFGLSGIFPEGQADLFSGLDEESRSKLVSATVGDAPWFVERFLDAPTGAPAVATAT